MSTLQVQVPLLDVFRQPSVYFPSQKVSFHTCGWMSLTTAMNKSLLGTYPIDILEGVQTQSNLLTQLRGGGKFDVEGCLLKVIEYRNCLENLETAILLEAY